MTNTHRSINIAAMQRALKEARDSIGKPTKSFHFVNEIRLIRYVLAGDSKSICNPKNLTSQELSLLRQVVCLNQRLIQAQVEYKLRKVACRELVVKARICNG